jgi:MFS family permease
MIFVLAPAYLIAILTAGTLLHWPVWGIYAALVAGPVVGGYVYHRGRLAWHWYTYKRHLRYKVVSGVKFYWMED